MARRGVLEVVATSPPDDYDVDLVVVVQHFVQGAGKKGEDAEAAESKEDKSLNCEMGADSTRCEAEDAWTLHVRVAFAVWVWEPILPPTRPVMQS